MPKAIFVDTSRCTACRGCQIACKEWKGFPAVPTKQRGSHQNPPDLTHYNYKLVRFNEHKIDGRVHWLFFPDQCRHCVQPPCKAVSDAYVPDAILQDQATGIVVYTEATKKLSAGQCKEITEACPYNIPRRNPENSMLTKCDMCIDRVQAGMIPSCVKVCCTGTMNFGERADMLALAKQRLETVRRAHPGALLVDPDDVGVVFLITQPKKMYHKYVERELSPLTRALFARLARPARTVAG
ncbi:4Fe-4S dicluster domain-containing protein [Fundidesulfovibrio agrisoli]|uniref:4Fe-4S dicluster domain-containing protein n=1 Tax=Fundidesulfovibrio agrisoli TaxID=2922717 RepID=UPI001FAD289F|nr:4Fe-4S dicluster domain-containing protein [Fundidesulfovibrio agrisoli]